MTSAVAEAPRRHLSPRQADNVDRLVAAAADEARAKGYEGLTVRNAARRANVAAATAYTYFASKDHLLVEVLWRRLDSLPPVDLHRGGPDRRGDRSATLDTVTFELGRLGTFMGDDPELAAACTTALLGAGADVRHMRDKFGGRILSRISTALGDRPDPVVLQTLNLALIGAMLSAGMGHIAFSDVPPAMAKAAALTLDEPAVARAPRVEGAGKARSRR